MARKYVPMDPHMNEWGETTKHGAHHDVHEWDVEDTFEEALSKVLAQIIDKLPEYQQQLVGFCVLNNPALARLEELDAAGRDWRWNYQEAARYVGGDHKKVKRHLDQALATIRQELVGTDWIMVLLKDRLPDQRQEPSVVARLEQGGGDGSPALPAPAPVRDHLNGLLAALLDEEAA